MEDISMLARKELLVSLHKKFQETNSKEAKTKIIDALVFACGYKRKYAISLLNKEFIIDN